MGDYAAIGDITARLPQRTIDGSSQPTQTQVEGWIDQIEALVNGHLEASGISTAVTASRGIVLLRGFVADRVSARVERAFASIRNEETDIGADARDALDDFLLIVQRDPARAKAMLGVDSGTSSSNLRAYVTDNDDSKTISGGDFDPEFEKDMDL